MWMVGVEGYRTLRQLSQTCENDEPQTGDKELTFRSSFSSFGEKTTI